MAKGKAVWKEIGRRFRWEKSVEIEGPTDPHEVLVRLQAQTVSSKSWKRLNRFTSRAPLVGKFSRTSGTIRLRDFYPSIGIGRELRFELEAMTPGTKVHGTLQLRPALQFYELFALAGMLALQGTMIYYAISARSINFRGILNILMEFGLIPFCWAYIRFVLWRSRKKEARMIEIVRSAITAGAPISRVGPVLRVRPSTPTEVFIRPRHESPERDPVG